MSLLSWLVLGGWLIGIVYAARVLVEKQGRPKDFFSYNALGVVATLWPLFLLGLGACAIFAGLDWLLSRLAKKDVPASL